MEILGRERDCHTERTAGEITEKTETGIMIMERFTRLGEETRTLLKEKDKAVEGGESTNTLTMMRGERGMSIITESGGQQASGGIYTGPQKKA